MSDSLRDQLLKAGFKKTEPDKPSKKPKPGKRKSATARGKQAGKSTDSTEETARLEREKKALKQKIKTLIESNCVKDYAGPESYGFLVGTRVRQLFVKEEHRAQLSKGELVITRLNGDTYLVPPETGKDILALNPQWAVFSNSDSDEKPDADGDYADYQVPDDLIW